MLLREVLKSPTQYKWIQNDPGGGQSKKVAVFTAGDREFEVNFYAHGFLKNGNEIWFTTFRPTDTKDDAMTGEGNALEIMSTVLAVIEDAIHTKGVKAMEIHAKLGDYGRVLLYKRLVGKLTKKFGWKVYDDEPFESKQEWLIGE